MSKIIKIVEVSNEELCRERWKKFCEELVTDTESFTFKELETAFICGWSEAVTHFLALWYMKSQFVELRKEDNA